MDNHAQIGQLALTDVEQALVGQVVAGEVLDLAHDTLDHQLLNEKAMRSWGPERAIRAVVIRDILRGRFAADPDPHGLRVRGARIDGILDLEHLTSTVPVVLVGCLLSEGVIAYGATLQAVIFDGCLLEHSSQPALFANRLTTTVLALTRSMVTARCKDGGVSLHGAHLGQLVADGATLANNAGPALAADGLTADQGVYLRGGFTATGAGELGAVRLLNGHIGGQLDCTGAIVTNYTGPAFLADGLTADQDVHLGGGFTATGTGEPGAVRLLNGHIGGQLDCTGATMTNDSGPALHAEGLTADQGVHLGARFTATGAGELGAVRLQGSHIGGQLDCTGATMTNKTGPALHADGLIADQSGAFLQGGFKAVGGGELGAVRFVGAHLARLQADGATLTNDTGPALSADGLNVDDDVYLRHRFTATGAGEPGAVRLLGGHIGGQLDCTGATLTNKRAGPALSADGLTVDDDVYLRHRFKATGAGELGAVRLLGGHIGGQLDCTGATLTNKWAGPALSADGLNVDNDVHLRGGFTATGGGDGVVVNLTGMRVGGVLEFSPDRLEHASRKPSDRLNVDGLTYAGLPAGITPKVWLQLIRKGTPSYAAQPYQYLAAALSAAGHDREARNVLIAQRQDQIDRHALTGWRERTWARFTGVMLGYGYRPSRALLYLLSVVIASVVLSVVLGGHGGLAQPIPPAGKPAVHCTVFQRVAVGLDLGEPLISTNAPCDITSSATGEALTIARWTLQVLAWALATLFIAGFTSAVRKT